MKKISKLALFTIASMFASSTVFAQEAEVSPVSSEEESSTEVLTEDSTDESSDFSSDWGSDDFGGDDFGFGEEESVSPTYYINAETGVDARGYIHSVTEPDDANVSDMATDAKTYANMTLGYSAQSSEMEFKLKFNKTTLEDYNESILDEATARVFLGNFVIEGGKMKVVWGKGDKLHVLDNFNANDYTDFIFGEYIDRRIAEPMLSAKFNVGNWSVQGVYTPMMTADRFASSGMWVPAKSADLTSGITKSASALVEKYYTEYSTLSAATGTINALGAAFTAADTAKTTAETNYATAAAAYQAYPTNAEVATAYQQAGIAVVAATVDYNEAKGAYEGAIAAVNSKLGTNYTSADDISNAYSAAAKSYLLSLTNASSLSSNTDSLYPDTNQLKYGQAGVRVLGTLGSVDLGLSYYYGHYKQPSVNREKMASAIPVLLLKGSLTDDQKFLAYDQKQTFGLEAAFVVWKFNTRWELGYNLTKDTAGDDPWVHNNSIEWLGGFDINLPIHNMNLNVQETGKFILNNGKIEDGVYKVYDVDYNSDGKYCQNKLVMNLSDNFLYENLKPEVTVIWGIENKEWCVQPKINYKVADGMNLGVSGAWLYSNNENGEFYNFTADCPNHHSKSFVQATVRYEF